MVESMPLSCPFCGSRDTFVDYSDEDMTAQVRCAGCHATGPVAPGAVAVGMWNRVSARGAKGSNSAPFEGWGQDEA